MGAQLSCREDRLPPLEIEGAPLTGHRATSCRSPAPRSSRACSSPACSPRARPGSASRARSRDHTERMLAAAGADVAWLRGGIVACGRRSGCEPGEFAVPADFSSAAFFLVAALLVPGSEVDLEGVGTQPDPDRPARRSSSGWAPRSRSSRWASAAASRSARSASAPRRCAAPRSAAPRSRWRSTSCRWSPSPPASPRARRRSATPPSCAARSPTGSPPPARR